MMYRKVVIGGYIIGIGLSENGNIDKQEYEELSDIITAMPTAPSGYTYKLRADTLEWELVELPPEPEPELTADEAIAILLGGANA